MNELEPAAPFAEDPVAQKRARRVPAGISSLRHHAARGTILNSGYQIGLSGLGLLQRLIVAAFLPLADFGLWALILTMVISLSWLKDVGVVDKYLQQDEDDQELAFQRAFTLELLSSVAFFLFVAAVLPAWALAYGRQEMIVPGMITALVVPLNAFQTPAWIAYRQMQYGRQRLLTSVAVVVGFIVTVTLAVLTGSYWCFVIGAVAGAVVGGVVCTLASPYRYRLRFDRAVARGYLTFSWPLVAAGLSGLVLVQGSLLVANETVGLAGVGAIGIVIGIVSFADRVDSVVSQTIYPAVCAVADKRAVLAEVFVKSNQLALLWAVPFSVGLALFADDLITFALGEKWRLAETLLVIIALTCGVRQVAFNWVVFLRALNQTKPIFIGAAVNVVVFLAIAVPGMHLWGLTGYGLAFAGSTSVQLLVRSHYMRRLFEGFRVLPHTLRAIAPTVPAAAAILVVRAGIGTEGRSPWQAATELVAYAAVAVACTLAFERQLVRELTGYLRRRPSP